MILAHWCRRTLLVLCKFTGPYDLKIQTGVGKHWHYYTAFLATLKNRKGLMWYLIGRKYTLFIWQARFLNKNTAPHLQGENTTTECLTQNILLVHHVDHNTISEYTTYPEIHFPSGNESIAEYILQNMYLSSLLITLRYIKYLVISVQNDGGTIRMGLKQSISWMYFVDNCCANCLQSHYLSYASSSWLLLPETTVWLLTTNFTET